MHISHFLYIKILKKEKDILALAKWDRNSIESTLTELLVQLICHAMQPQREREREREREASNTEEPGPSQHLTYEYDHMINYFILSLSLSLSLSLFLSFTYVSMWLQVRTLHQPKASPVALTIHCLLPHNCNICFHLSLICVQAKLFCTIHKCIFNRMYNIFHLIYYINYNWLNFSSWIKLWIEGSV
jgi:hypothetical protein